MIFLQTPTIVETLEPSGSHLPPSGDNRRCDMWFDPFANHFLMLAAQWPLDARGKQPHMPVAEKPTRRERRDQKRANRRKSLR